MKAAKVKQCCSLCSRDFAATLIVPLIFLALSNISSGDIVTETPNVSATNVSISEKTLRDGPIVIHTQVQSYDQPTMEEYQRCHADRDQCLKVCETTVNRTACESVCPTCPVLIQQNIVVQGVNDTNLRPAPVTPLNTTNVIRLTNEIHNIIDNNMGNITARNENTVHVVQPTSSRTGGKFGLGFDEHGPCCIVLRASKNCDAQRFSTAARCHHKRHRVCGENCKARVMRAKIVRQCSQEDANDANNCQQRVVYEPFRRHAKARCHATQSWPFVVCRGQRDTHGSLCRQCLQVPYGTILQHGIPPRCSACYSSYNPMWFGSGLYSDLYAPPPTYDKGFDWNNEFLPSNDGWKVDKTKCRRADGTITEDCADANNDNVDSGSGNGHPVGDGAEFVPDLEDGLYANDDDNDIDADYVEDETRRRRSPPPFRRSRYSRRNRRLY